MFDKIKAMFETFSQSSTYNNDPTLRSINTKMGPSYAAAKIIDLLKDLKYKTINYNETYNELFTRKAGFEVTIHCLMGTNGGTSVDVSVYSPQNRGKTRKALRYLLHAINEVLNNG